jgi:hypothetical protein
VKESKRQRKKTQLPKEERGKIYVTAAEEK